MPGAPYHAEAFPLLALGLVGLVGVRTAITLSIIPGLQEALASVYAVRFAPRARSASGNRRGCVSGRPSRDGRVG